MPDIETMQLILELAILFLLLYQALLKSYFQEKGKNAATKEDIEEITSLIESVKSQLQFSLQAKLSFRAEEHQALVDYFSKYSAWLSAINNCSTVGINNDNASRLAEIRAELDMLYKDFCLAAGKMELFVENDNIRSQHGPLIIETLKYQAHSQQTIFRFEEIHLEAKQMLLTTPSENQQERYRELLGRENELYRKYKEEQIAMYRTILPLVQIQQRAISKHLKALTDG